MFEKLSGDKMTAFADTWKGLNATDRQAFLLEHHEFAHHALMFSTPVGVLNWRLNQVISRDVQWILKKCQDFGESFSTLTPPREVVSARVWQVAFKRRADVPRDVKNELLLTINSLEDMIQLRALFFEPGAAERFADMTFRDLLALLKRSFAYLGRRCDVAFPQDWRTKLPLCTKVFTPDRSFNLVDIAEVHAIAMELFILRAVGDIEAMNRRIDEARNGSYGTAVSIAVDATKEVNELGVSPHQMQVQALIAFSATLDIRAPSTKELYLEEVLPWWRFSTKAAYQPATYIDALRNCLIISTEPLIGPGSRWLQMVPLPPNALLLTPGGMSGLFTTLTSLGLDRQVHAIHRGATLNWRYLATQFEDSFAEKSPFPFDRLNGEEWRGHQQMAALLVEYTDGLNFQHADFDALYPADSPYRTAIPDLDHYADPAYQLLAQLLNGALPRVAYASYAGRAVPALSVLEPKLANYLGNPELARSTIAMISPIVEGSMSVSGRHLTLMPETLTVDRYI